MSQNNRLNLEEIQQETNTNTFTNLKNKIGDKVSSILGYETQNFEELEILLKSIGFDCDADMDFFQGNDYYEFGLSESGRTKIHNFILYSEFRKSILEKYEKEPVSKKFQKIADDYYKILEKHNLSNLTGTLKEKINFALESYKGMLEDTDKKKLKNGLKELEKFYEEKELIFGIMKKIDFSDLSRNSDEFNEKEEVVFDEVLQEAHDKKNKVNLYERFNIKKEEEIEKEKIEIIKPKKPDKKIVKKDKKTANKQNKKSFYEKNKGLIYSTILGTFIGSVISISNHINKLKSEQEKSYTPHMTIKFPPIDSNTGTYNDINKSIVGIDDHNHSEFNYNPGIETLVKAVINYCINISDSVESFSENLSKELGKSDIGNFTFGIYWDITGKLIVNYSDLDNNKEYEITTKLSETKNYEYKFNSGIKDFRDLVSRSITDASDLEQTKKEIMLIVKRQMVTFLNKVLDLDIKGESDGTFKEKDNSLVLQFEDPLFLGGPKEIAFPLKGVSSKVDYEIQETILTNISNSYYKINTSNIDVSEDEYVLDNIENNLIQSLVDKGLIDNVNTKIIIDLSVDRNTYNYYIGIPERNIRKNGGTVSRKYYFASFIKGEDGTFWILGADGQGVKLIK